MIEKIAATDLVLQISEALLQQGKEKALSKRNIGLILTGICK